VQTFLPDPDFATSAGVLDRQRLGKQRVETLQIMTALLTGTGWVNHPATKMWRGHEVKLLHYQAAICDEWENRGYQDTCWVKTLSLAFKHGIKPLQVTVDPSWLGDEAFHLSHRSNLFRKNPAHYGAFWPDVPADLPYVWPVRED